MKQLFIVAGHDLVKDCGAIAYDGTTEAELTAQLRDDVCRKLDNAIMFNGTSIKDKNSESLIQTIQQINARADNSDFILDIHFNYNASNAYGTEVFYYAGTSLTNMNRGMAISSVVAHSIGVPDRGVKPDTQAAVGSLGILRYTPCPALLLEVCFMNERDLTKYRANYDALVENLSSYLAGIW